MPRGNRLDAPGALHHVMQRGMDRGKIFRDSTDYGRFLDHAGRVFPETRTRCVAWALMPNHIHLLLQTGVAPLARVLQRLFTRYAVTFNRRWRRSGHLFQGRYRSILCEAEPYLLALVRYIHLNPVRAGLCSGLRELEGYPWTGHRALLGKDQLPWQDTVMVLEEFGVRVAGARASYEAFCREGLKEAPDRQLPGESLRHLDAGGWETLRIGHGKRADRVDERLLGSAGFVERALKAADEEERWRSRARRHGVTLERILALAASKAGIGVEDITGSGKRPAQVRARALACHWLVGRLGYSGVMVARRLGITQAGVSKSAARGACLPEGAHSKFPSA